LYVDNGAFIDLSGNGLTVTNSGSTTTKLATGKTVNSFNGVDNLITVSDHAALDVTSITILQWVYLSVMPSKGGASLNREGVYKIFLGSAGGVSASLATVGKAWSGSGAQVGITQGKWTQVGITYAASTGYVTLYSNGRAIGQDTTTFAGTGNIITSANPVTINKTSDNWNSPLQGMMGSTMIYSRALSASEVKQNYDAEKGLYSSYLSPVRDISLRLEYNMAGNAKDLSGNGNDGTVSGAVWKELPNGQWCAQLDGTDDYIDAGNMEEVTSVTLEVWAKLAGTPPTGAGWCLMNRKLTGGIVDQGYMLHVNNTAMVARVGDGTNFVNPTATVAIDQNWHHYMLTYDGNAHQVKAYYDGAYVTSATNTSIGSINRSDVPLGIGQLLSGNGYHKLKGAIGCARFYNKALSAAEVYQNYEADRWKYQDDGLIYELDMAQTPPADLSLNQSYALTTSGSPTKAAMTSGAYAYTYAAADYHYTTNTNIPASLKPSKEITIEVISMQHAVNTVAIDGLVSQYDASGGYLLAYNQNMQKPFLWIRNGAADFAMIGTDNDLTLDTFYHIIARRTATGEMRLFINGTKQTATTNYAKDISYDGSAHFTVARYGANTAGGMKIALVRIYNRALSDLECKQHYEAEKWRTQ
jgi:hypothetical protein